MQNLNQAPTNYTSINNSILTRAIDVDSIKSNLGKKGMDRVLYIYSDLHEM